MKYLICLCFVFIALCNTTNAEMPVFADSLEDAVALSESSKKDILVIFGAEWCGYCTRTKKDIDNNLSKFQDTIIVYVDIDKREDLKREYMVKSIPDYMLLQKCIETKRKVGYMKISQLIDFIKK